MGSIFPLLIPGLTFTFLLKELTLEKMSLTVTFTPLSLVNV